MLLLLLVLCNMGGEDDARTLHAVLGTTLLMRAGAPTPTHMTRLVPRLTVKSAKTERAHTHTRATCTGTRNCPHGTDMHGRARAFRVPPRRDACVSTCYTSKKVPTVRVPRSSFVLEWAGGFAPPSGASQRERERENEQSARRFPCARQSAARAYASLLLLVVVKTFTRLTVVVLL